MELSNPEPLDCAGVEVRFGSLKAVKATPVLVPPESGRSQKVAFLAKDGAILKQAAADPASRRSA